MRTYAAGVGLSPGSLHYQRPLRQQRSPQPMHAQVCLQHAARVVRRASTHFRRTQPLTRPAVRPPPLSTVQLPCGTQLSEAELHLSLKAARAPDDVLDLVVQHEQLLTPATCASALARVAAKAKADSLHYKAGVQLHPAFQHAGWPCCCKR